MLVLLVILLVFSCISGVCFGAVRLSLGEVISAAFGAEGKAERIIRCIRIPRVFGSVLSGAALALSGVIIQAVLGNPLASPGVIGVNAGAGFFVTLFSALMPAAVSLLPLAAFFGAFSAVAAVFLIARKAELSRITLVLAGTAISALFNAATDTVTELFPDTLSGVASFKIGGLGGITIDKLSPAWIIILVGIVLAFLLNRELDMLSLGGNAAFTLGMNVKAVRAAFLIIAAALAGAAVSFAGILGFVGLIVPHICRRIIGCEGRWLIPASVLMGASFVTLCDVISRTVFSPNEISLGIVISYIGAPFFIYLLLRKKGGNHNA